MVIGTWNSDLPVHMVNCPQLLGFSRCLHLLLKPTYSVEKICVCTCLLFVIDAIWVVIQNRMLFSCLICVVCHSSALWNAERKSHFCDIRSLYAALHSTAYIWVLKLPKNHTRDVHMSFYIWKVLCSTKFNGGIVVSLFLEHELLLVFWAH